MGTSKMFCDQINLHSRDRLKTWCVLCSVIIVHFQASSQCYNKPHSKSTVAPSFL